MSSGLVNDHLRHIAQLEHKFGPDSEDVAVALTTLVKLIFQYDIAEDAEPYFARAIAIRENLKGPEAILGALDEWIKRPVRFESIEPYLLKRLAIEAAALGEIDPRIADQCDIVAAKYRDQKRYQDAGKFSERALAIRENLAGGDSAEVATALEALVDTCFRARREKDAEAYLERCVAAKERLFGARSNELATTLISLALTCAGSAGWKRSRIRADKLHKAETLFARGLAINEDLFGLESFEVRKALEAMAQSYLACHEFWKAEPLLTRWLSIDERIYGKDAPALLWIVVDLAEGYARERSAKAEPLVQRGFELLRKMLDVKNPVRHTQISASTEGGALYSRGSPGLLERLIGASEIVRSNLRQRWGGRY